MDFAFSAGGGSGVCRMSVAPMKCRTAKPTTTAANEIVAPSDVEARGFFTYRRLMLVGIQAISFPHLPGIGGKAPSIAQPLS
jgi:hypothetical protein